MKKIILIIFLLPLFAQAQTYQLNYDSIRVGKTAGAGGISLYGNTWVKNVIHTPDIRSKFPIADVRAYGTIAQAITAIGSTPTTLLIPTTQAVTSSVTIPSTITLQVLKGAIITISSGQTLTINGGLDAGLYQIFAGSGTVVFQRGSSNLAYPEWWYTGSGTYHTAINQALTATAAKGIPVQLSGKTYATTGTIAVGEDNVLQGVQGRYTTTVIDYSGSTNAITVKDDYNFGTVKKLAITGGTTATAIGILVARPYTLVEDVFIYNFKGEAGIKVTDSASTSGGYLSRLNRIIIYGNTPGVAALGDLKFGIWLSSQANAITVSDYSGNYVGTSGGAGLYVDGGVGINIDNINIENGYSGSFTVHGILLNGGSDINLHNPYFENNNKNLVVNTGSGVIVDNIYINGFGQSSVGIQVNNPASRVTIRSGVVANIGGSGTDIELVSSPVNVQIQNVKTDDGFYTGNSTKGINLNDGSITVGDVKGQNHSGYTPKLSTVSTVDSTRVNAMDYFAADANSSVLAFGKSRGTLASPAYPVGNDILGRVSFSGWNEANSRFDINADYNVIANGNWSGSNRGTTHEWYTTPTGSTTRAIGMTLSGLGDLTTIGKITLADEAYTSSWNGKLESPTKNAIWDAGFTSGSGTASYVPKFTSGSAIGNSLIYDDGSNIGIGTTSPYGISNYRFITTNQTTGGGLVMQTAGVNKAAVYNTSGGLWLEGGLITIGNSGIAASTGVKIATLTGTGTEMVTVDNAGNLSRQAIPSGGGGGSVNTVGVTSANGFAGTSSGGANPALTLSTTITADVLKADGTAISGATTTGTSGTAVVLATSPTLVTPNLGTPSTLVGTNITGTASGLTAGAITGQANSATITAASTASINTIALRDANADVFARTFNMNTSYGDFAPTKLVGTSAGGQIREMSQAQAKTYLDLSGTNTGDQTITLTGAVTGSGTGSFATTLASGIDATKLADGTVTSTELQYINTLSSNAQNQLDLKANLANPTFTGTVTLPTGTIGVTQSAADNSTKLATTAYVDRLGGGTVTSGTYTPTLTNVTNVTSSTAYPTRYERIGNNVTVSGILQIVPVTTTGTQLDISLPISSNFLNSYECSGLAWVGNSDGTATRITNDTTTDKARLVFNSTGVTTTVNFQFSYIIQ